MNRRVSSRGLITVSLLLIAACGSSSDRIAEAGMSCEKHVTIHVVVNGLEHTEGQVLVALYASKDGFPNKETKAARRGIAPMDGDTATASFTFEPVAQGTYAVSVLHDEDGDGKMKTAAFGRPAEGWGVSNDAKGRFGPPSFEDAAFEAHADSLTVEVKLHY